MEQKATKVRAESVDLNELLKGDNAAMALLEMAAGNDDAFDTEVDKVNQTKTEQPKEVAPEIKKEEKVIEVKAEEKPEEKEKKSNKLDEALGLVKPPKVENETDNDKLSKRNAELEAKVSMIETRQAFVEMLSSLPESQREAVSAKVAEYINSPVWDKYQSETPMEKAAAIIKMAKGDVLEELLNKQETIKSAEVRAKAEDVAAKNALEKIITAPAAVTNVEADEATKDRELLDRANGGDENAKAEYIWKQFGMTNEEIKKII